MINPERDTTIFQTVIKFEADNLNGVFSQHYHFISFHSKTIKSQRMVLEGKRIEDSFEAMFIKLEVLLAQNHNLKLIRL